MYKIKIEKFSAADFKYYFTLVNNAEVMQMITERAIERNEAKSDFERLLQNNAISTTYGSYKILGLDTNDFYGLAKLEITHKHAAEAEIGYMVLPEYWNKGIASQVTKKLIGMARSGNRLKRLTAVIDPKNIPSRKILINNGFVSKYYKDFDGLPGEVLEMAL